MGVNAGSLQVIDIKKVIFENRPIALLYGTYLPVALGVFVVHTVEERFHNRLIYEGVDISIHALLIGGRS